MKIELKNLTKYYGDFCAVEDVSFSFSSNKLTALCGRNGSGKTTSIRCLLGLLKLDGGEIFINGLSKKPDLKTIGYLSEERGLFIKETIGFQLEFIARLKGSSRKNAIEMMDYWLEYFNISEYKNKKLEKLSKGNQQKIQIIAALVHDPDIIIFDEPFSGLDPINANLVINLIKDLKKKNKCILISSHQLSLIEDICEDICIIDKGKSIYSGSMADLKKEFGSNYLYFTTKSKVESLKAEIISPQSYRIKLSDNSDDYKLRLTELMNANIEIDSLERKALNLQEIFIKIAGDKVTDGRNLQ